MSARRSLRARLPRRGMTLLELLLVMMLMGVVMGLGVGAFASLDPGRGAAVEIVRGALRSAVNAARASHAPASVSIDRAAGTLCPRGLTVVGTWHFERPDLEGAFGIRGRGIGTRLAKGALGTALELPDGANARAELDVRDDPAFEFRRGFAVECRLAPERSHSAHVVNVGGALGIYMLSTGAVRVWFVSAEENGEPSGEVVLDGPPAVLLPGRWTRVRAEYDGRTLALDVDGVRVAELEATEKVADLTGPLLIGGGRTPYVGRIDELVISAWEAGDPQRLAESVSLVGDVPEEVRFDAAGHLDSARHPEPVRLTLELEGGDRKVVTVGRWGTVE